MPRAKAPCIPFTKRSKRIINRDQEGRLQGSAVLQNEAMCVANVHGSKVCPKGVLADSLRRILLAILWRSVTMIGMVECLHPERMWRALSGSPQRGHCRLVEILKRTIFKGKPGGVMERIAFKVDTGESCVCRGVITLNSLVFGNGICAFVTCNSSVRFNLVAVNRGSEERLLGHPGERVWAIAFRSVGVAGTAPVLGGTVDAVGAYAAGWARDAAAAAVGGGGVAGFALLLMLLLLAEEDCKATLVAALVRLLHI
eukprot:1160757-Pelagomonas_calceolata.AAC.1